MDVVQPGVLPLEPCLALVMLCVIRALPGVSHVMCDNMTCHVMCHNMTTHIMSCVTRQQLSHFHGLWTVRQLAQVLI